MEKSIGQKRVNPSDISCLSVLALSTPHLGKLHVTAGRDSSVECEPTWYADGRGFAFVEIGHEIISTAILCLPLIQEGQLSVTGERMCTKYW